MISEYRQKVLDKIDEYERLELWDKDVEDDPETIVLEPDKADYLQEKPFAKLSSFIANKVAVFFFEKQIKKKNLVISDIVGIENFTAVKGGAFITCNHFHPFDNYAVYRAIRKHLPKKQRLYKVIREGNYTNFKGLYGYFFRHCNTLPLSSNMQTMKKFLKAVSILLAEGKKILIYPEQGMWYNYRKPRPMKSGAFNMAVKNNVPIIPFFITMKDTDKVDGDGLFIQAYTVHILPAIYPDNLLTAKENCEYMKNKNYEAWKEIYEKTYGVKLVYNKD